ncbi:MAG TPA: patatin-like phospholipase family protein [Vicinamibacterales bacterium]|nr:patatin-like phospholipase family protein [Vicinamibacterales bacterium]
MARGTRAQHDLYSPERPTALIVSGTGADGAYHAGVLKALHEAGVKIDLVAGRGIGAFGAILFAVDGAALLWEANGFWHQAALSAAYGLRWPYRLTGWALAAGAGILASPLALLVGALVVWPVAMAAGLVGLDASRGLAQGYGQVVAWAFAPEHAPTWMARLLLLVAGLLAVTLGAGAVLAAWRSPRRLQGNSGWRLLGAPVESAGFVGMAAGTLWDLMRGGAAVEGPTAADLSQRAAELLVSSVNQPGHRDVLMTVHDLDARRDLVFGLISGEAGKRQFPGSTGPAARRAEAFDLATTAKSALVDALSGALTLPGVSEPHPMRFAGESVWRGEVHRLADRPAALSRLLEEAAAAGMEQAILITATPEPGGPHELEPPRVDPRGRVGEWLAGEEAAAVRDAVRYAQAHFHTVFVIRPGHNPVAALDLTGAYDRGSDRQCTLRDLVERGYEDAHRLFIEPALGAAGERVRGTAW